MTDYTQFLAELTELTRKHRIEICPGYEGAFLWSEEERDKPSPSGYWEKGRYVYSGGTDDFRWVDGRDHLSYIGEVEKKP